MGFPPRKGHTVQIDKGSFGYKIVLQLSYAYMVQKGERTGLKRQLSEKISCELGKMANC